MSSYENYSRTVRHYDRTRVPVGLEILLGCLARSSRHGGVCLVDAGCGTGSYTEALVAHVERIEAVDLNPAMLERARAKLSTTGHADRVRFHRGAIDELPFPDASADAVTINQVLHHLEAEPERDHPAYRRVFTELARVLRPGGIVVINTCAPMQLRQGFWFYHLIEDAVEAMCARHLELGTLARLLDECGFEAAGRFVPIDGVIQGHAYFDPRGPLDAGWRDGDSIWALVDDEALARVTTRVRALDRRGALERFRDEHDAPRHAVGQVTFLCATRRR